MNRTILSVLLLSSAFIISCNNKGENHPIEKMRYFEFTVSNLDESFNFYAAASDAELLATLDSELAIPFEDRTHHINGFVNRDNGGYNKNLDWHYIPNEWELAQVSIELCDGYPADPKERAPYNWCPWFSKLKNEVFL